MLKTLSKYPVALAAPFAALSLFLALQSNDLDTGDSQDPIAQSGVAVTGVPSLGAAISLPVSLENAEVVARVNGRSILSASVDAIVAQAAEEEPDTDAVIEDIIDMEILAQAAEAAGLHRQPEIAAELMLQYTQTLANAWIANESVQAEHDAEALREMYNERVASLPDNEFRARHILVESQEDAIEIIALLDGGEDFNSVAQDRSIDTRAHLGWVTGRTAVPQLVQALAALEVDTFSPEPVKTEFGYHVVYLDETRASARPDFDAVKPQLLRVAVEKLIEDRLAELRAAATIERL